MQRKTSSWGENCCFLLLGERSLKIYKLILSSTLQGTLYIECCLLGRVEGTIYWLLQDGRAWTWRTWYLGSDSPFPSHLASFQSSYPSLPFRGLLFTCLCFDDVASQLRYQTFVPGVPKVLGLLYNFFFLAKVDFISLTDELRLKPVFTNWKNKHFNTSALLFYS